MKYNPALDGVRALSVLAVVGFHTNFPLLLGGYIGVDVFFVLSGFLITTILRAEQASGGQINLVRFFVRRLVRLTPPLVLSLLSFYLLYAIFFPWLDLKPDLLAGLLYFSDYGVAFWQVPQYLKHTWSLSVEEHFYLLWPLFLVATRRIDPQKMVLAIGLLFFAGAVWRTADFLIWDNFARTYYRFDTRLTGILLGSLLAIRPIAVDRRGATILGKASIIMLVFMALMFRWHSSFYIYVGMFFAEIAAAMMIVSLTSGHQTYFGRLLSNRGLIYVGVLSYSIYLWHYGLAIVLRDFLNPWLSFPITLAASILLATLSYELIEAPLRAWVRRTQNAGRKRPMVEISPS